MEGTLGPGGEAEVEVNLDLRAPRRWDIQDPVLHTARTTIRSGGRVRDVYDTPFGVRTIRFDPDHGFWLNDRRVQLEGVNLHHDHGPLGAAFHPRAMQRKLKIMKAMGANAIRTSHSAEAPEVLALADSMGLLLFNEVFDKCDGKADITAETDFEEFAHRNIRSFVRREVNYVRTYDPTRPVTLVNDNPDAPVLRAFDFYDVLTWNYSRRWAWWGSPRTDSGSTGASGVRTPLPCTSSPTGTGRRGSDGTCRFSSTRTGIAPSSS